MDPQHSGAPTLRAERMCTAADSDDRPQRFDRWKRPGLVRDGIEGSSVRSGETQDKEVRAIFKSRYQDRGPRRSDAEDLQGHMLRTKVKKSPELSLQHLSDSRGQITDFDTEREASAACGSASAANAC
jgi:hypothetical protein